MPRVKLSDSFMERQPLPAKQTFFYQTPPLETGVNLAALLSPGGTKRPHGTRRWYAIVYTDKGETRRVKLGRYPQQSLKDAKAQAIAYWKNPSQAAEQASTGTFAEVSAEWVKRIVAPEKSGGYLRGDETQRILDRYVLTAHVVKRKDKEIIIDRRTKPFLQCDRTAVNQLLDIIEDRHSAIVADTVLSVLSSIMSWWATRTGSYISPIVKGMKRDKRSPKERRRSRVLNEAEIATVWRACEGSVFGGLCRLALLTGSRREKLAQMRWSDIREGVIRIEVPDPIPGDPDHTKFIERAATLWHIRNNNPREKGTANVLPLSPLALQVLSERMKIDSNPYVFPSRRGHFVSWSGEKALLDANLPADMPKWTVHTLRHTVRTLLSKCRVQTEVAEKVLGHSLKGMQAVYNHDEMLEQLDIAMTKLSSRISRIIDPAPANVVMPFPQVA